MADKRIPPTPPERGKPGPGSAKPMSKPEPAPAKPAAPGARPGPLGSAKPSPLRKETEAAARSEAELEARSADLKAAQAKAPAAPVVKHTVAAGETLSHISDKYYKTPNRWKEIYEANKAVIGDNPSLIKPGQVLVIPGAA